ncbi:hypothetical protein [Thermocrispum sp.]|uniref:hypothetical protein n=1 Tax=Thermocrispum sp. TaxID=2060768 RepID=UPI00257BE61F|nr:hypothetical protein [Thermocrispum sp.]
MSRKFTWITGLAGAAAALAFAAAPVSGTDAAAAVADAPPGAHQAHPITAEEFEQLAEAAQQPGATTVAGWPVPEPRSYHITSSCAPYASAIRQGAAAWEGLTEGGGTPVECRNNYITDCGGGSNVVGCNWGMGQRIALYPGGVNDVALLAAHEFGHDWYGHSNYQCAGWGSPAEVMAPTICNYWAGTGQRLDSDQAG